MAQPGDRMMSRLLCRNPVKTGYGPTREPEFPHPGEGPPPRSRPQLAQPGEGVAAAASSSLPGERGGGGGVVARRGGRLQRRRHRAGSAERRVPLLVQTAFGPTQRGGCTVGPRGARADMPAWARRGRGNRTGGRRMPRAGGPLQPAHVRRWPRCLEREDAQFNQIHNSFSSGGQ